MIYFYSYRYRSNQFWPFGHSGVKYWALWSLAFGIDPCARFSIARFVPQKFLIRGWVYVQLKLCTSLSSDPVNRVLNPFNLYNYSGARKQLAWCSSNKFCDRVIQGTTQWRSLSCISSLLWMMKKPSVCRSSHAQRPFSSPFWLQCGMIIQ